MFEVGKYYTHIGGRQISVIAEVTTDKWGKMQVIEEADKTGHGISCAEVKEGSGLENAGWIEISREEWMRNFEEQVCAKCDKVFVDGDKFVPTTQGPIHVQCYSKMIQDQGPDIVQPVSLN